MSRAHMTPTAQQPMLRSKRLVMRGFVEADIPKLASLLEDPALARPSLWIPYECDELEIAEWVETTAPEEQEEGHDHVPGLLRQLSREPRSRPRVEIADKPLDELEYDDIQLREYESAEGIRFEVAE